MSPAHYRNGILSNSRILVRHVKPPYDIQFQVNAIFSRRISKEAGTEISRIAKGKSNQFTAIAKANRRQDDCVEVVITALDTLDKEKIFAFVGKADWTGNLKANPPQLFGKQQKGGWSASSADYVEQVCMFSVGPIYGFIVDRY
ncbi:uncharacterized protein A1O5_11635 [Cladophialophora psammophila CBS 110553]|uniref:Uncharacterized protein n=1 Tax=Cladophialophora psammophila CBS 110553 TaxID=1182543 RepID=W9WYJ2_9EURO|nr:uncharacterized protein A1O5_11635 [Cladophialophora psammophila CBS 110553]EXJ63314.1 hypothetical protein A1O5_11635 [Cladophialophora psammophila CBS 110553]